MAERGEGGLTPPVALLLGPDEEMKRRLGELGYTFFRSKERLVWYIEHLVGADIDGDDVIGDPDAEGWRRGSPPHFDGGRKSARWS